MKRKNAWKAVVNALRLHYLQNNSHIDSELLHIWIDERVVETLDVIRKTKPTKGTETLVAEISN